MKSQGSGQRVLRFAVTGALLGGGAATGCAKKADNVNVAPVEEPMQTNAGRMDEPPPEEPHTNVGPEDEPHSNAGPEPEPKDGEVTETTNVSPEPVPPKYVNTRKVDDDKPPPSEKPTIIANPAPQPDPGN